MSTLDAFGSVAVTSMVTLAITELHVELLAGGAAFLVGWWLLREPGQRLAVREPPSAPRKRASHTAPPTSGA